MQGLGSAHRASIESECREDLIQGAPKLHVRSDFEKICCICDEREYGDFCTVFEGGGQSYAKAVSSHFLAMHLVHVSNVPWTSSYSLLVCNQSLQAI
jgi:hypothetical protein